MVEGGLVCQVGSPQVGGIVRSAKATIVFNPQVKHVVSGRLAFVVGQSVLAEDAICLDVGRPVSIQAGFKANACPGGRNARQIAALAGKLSAHDIAEYRGGQVRIEADRKSTRLNSSH